jgi:hypothetical protein
MVLNGDTAADNIVQQVFQAVSGNAPTAKLANSIEDTIKTVSLIVAGTIILVKTDKEDADAETSLDPTLRKQFETQSQQLLAELFEPTSQDLKALQPNTAFKDHMESLVVQIAKTVQEKYLPLATDKLSAMAMNPPPLVPAVQLRSYIASHNPNLDANVVNAVVSKTDNLIQAMFKNWLLMASKESSTGRRATHSFELLRDWAKDALVLVDNMAVGGQPAAKPTQPAKVTPDEEINELTASHDAGVEALQTALQRNPNLSPDQMRTVYNNARQAYDKTQPTT